MFFLNQIGEYLITLLSGLGFKTRASRPVDLPSGNLWRTGRSLRWFDGDVDRDVGGEAQPLLFWPFTKATGTTIQTPNWTLGGTGWTTVSQPAQQWGGISLNVANGTGDNEGHISTVDTLMQFNKLLSFKARVKIDALAKGTTQIGFMGPGVYSNSGLYFSHAGGAANWFAQGRFSGASGSSADTGVVADTNYNDFEIVVASTASVRYYINGVLVATLTTNLPNPTQLFNASIQQSALVAGTVNLSATFAMMRQTF